MATVKRSRQRDAIGELFDVKKRPPYGRGCV